MSDSNAVEQNIAVTAVQLLHLHWPEAIRDAVGGSSCVGAAATFLRIEVLSGTFGCLRDGASFPLVLISPANACVSTSSEAKSKLYRHV